MDISYHIVQRIIVHQFYCLDVILVVPPYCPVPGLVNVALSYFSYY